MIKRLTYLVMALALAVGCSAREDIPEGGTIMVSAGVDGAQTTTKTVSGAIPYKGTAPTAENPLAAAVWFGTTSGVYPEGTAHTLPRRNTVLFTSSTLTFPDEILAYPVSGSVYAVGLNPRTGWTVDGGNTVASIAIDGNTDIMFAPQVEASSVNHFNSSTKKLQFSHLLTWVLVRVVASDYEAPTSWGNIKKISIATAANVSVTLGSGAVTYPGSQTIDVYDDLAGTGTPLQITAQGIGAVDGSGELKGVFCAPAASYNVTVYTANVPLGLTKEVPLKQLDGSAIDNVNTQVKGKVFVLTLYFNRFHVIDASCTLADWDDDYGIIEGNVS